VDRRLVFSLGGAIVLGLALLLTWSIGPGRNSDWAANLTEMTDPATIQHAIQLTHLSIATSDTFAGNIRIRNITGLLTNISDKTVRKIDLKMTFTDYDGKIVQESAHTVFASERMPLNPGGQYRFEVNFENLPRTWNYHVPNTQIVRVGY
jgi:hypothetical protein